MENTIRQLKTIGGEFFRTGPESTSDDVLRGALAPQGRFHHDSESALYMSPKPEWARQAMASYPLDEGGQRIVHRLMVSDCFVVDTRDRELCALLKINPLDAAVPWQPQFAKAVRPATWNVSDAARQVGADGLVYTARTDPNRWHLVLFRWNKRGGPTVTRDGNFSQSF